MELSFSANNSYDFRKFLPLIKAWVAELRFLFQVLGRLNNSGKSPFSGPFNY